MTIRTCATDAAPPAVFARGTRVLLDGRRCGQRPYVVVGHTPAGNPIIDKGSGSGWPVKAERLTVVS